MASRFPRAAALTLAALVVLALVWPAAAQDGQPMLHEFLPPDTREDLNLSSTTNAGNLPAAIKTPSGTIRPPDVRRTPPPGHIYHQPSERSPSFQPDRDTRRPHVEHYDDPFTPAMTPFKRLFAYDAVRDDYSLYVRDEQHRVVPVQDTTRQGEERFFGDMAVMLSAGQYVRVPSVGPGARVLRLVSNPEMGVSVWRDSAENWFVSSTETGRVRLITELSIPRDTFGSQFADVPWSALAPVPVQPSRHRAAYRKVAKAIGISRRKSPRQVVFEMVAYFRSFAPSDESPSEHGDVYLDLALSRRGVCRHRAFAFLITALNVGIPARLVHNEAHAWVEAHDGRLWHRIDLGGAALDLEEDPRLDRPPHRPPPDPYSWPTGRDSGSDLANRTRQEAIEQNAANNPDGPDGPSEPPDGPGVDPNAPPGDPPAHGDQPTSTLEIERVDHDIFRGLPMHLKGTVQADGKACARVRVDVLLLVAGESAERRLGSLSTDDAGTYDGAVVLPPDLPIGDHELVVATAGGKHCGPGQAR